MHIKVGGGERAAAAARRCLSEVGCGVLEGLGVSGGGGQWCESALLGFR